MTMRDAADFALLIEPARAADATQVARLHAESWRATYRGMLSDAYLDEAVFADRAQLWRERFSDGGADKLRIFVARSGDALAGFVCVLLDAEAAFGSLLDNLHIAPGQTGRGLGRVLMARAAQTVLREGVTGALHLWVFAANRGARRFYERLGGVASPEETWAAPDGTQASVLRYDWATRAAVQYLWERAS